MKVELSDHEVVILRLALRYALPQLDALNTEFADVWPGVVKVPPDDDEQPSVTRKGVADLLRKLDAMAGVLALEDYDAMGT